MPDGGRLAAADFIAEVRRAASDGYFAFNSVVENFTHCFAAPVRQADGACIATLCLVTPREDGLNNRDAYLDSLLRAAREISEKLGFNPSPARSRAEPRRPLAAAIASAPASLATRHSPLVAHGALLARCGSARGWHFETMQCIDCSRPGFPLVNAGQSPGTSFKFRFVLCRHSDGHSLIPWQKAMRARLREVVYFHAPVFDPMHQPCSWPDPRPRSAARLPAETQQSNQKFPRTFNEIPPIRRSRLLAAFILTGCNTISPRASQRNPRHATRKKNAIKSFPR